MYTITIKKKKIGEEGGGGVGAMASLSPSLVPSRSVELFFFSFFLMLKISLILFWGLGVLRMKFMHVPITKIN